MSDDPLVWKTLSSRVVLSDRWLHVRADTCETSEGARVDPYYVIEAADFVAMVAVTPERQLVLVRQYRHAIGAVTLELPAGMIDAGETPLVAARRELLEETGHAGRSARVLRPLATNTQRYTNRMHTVLITDASPVGAPKNDVLERVETVLWPVDRTERLFDEPDFVNAVFVGALALGLAALKR